MYKRQAHILFLAETGSPRGDWVAQLANLAQQEFLAARSASLAPGDPPEDMIAELVTQGFDIRPTPSPALGQNDLEWADLIVTLDEASRRHVSGQLPDKPTRHWPPAWGSDAGALIDDVLSRLESMVGGMRMLARADADAPQDSPR